jgi:hypothetical protein
MCKIQRFITMFTMACYCTLLWTSLFQSPPHTISLRSVLILSFYSVQVFETVSYLWVFRLKRCICFSSVRNIWYEVQIMKFPFLLHSPLFQVQIFSSALCSTYPQTQQSRPVAPASACSSTQRTFYSAHLSLSAVLPRNTPVYFEFLLKNKMLEYF